MLKRLSVAALALLLNLVVIAGAWLWWQAKRAEPSYAGELVLPGLGAPVAVRFGPHAVPSIAAGSTRDLVFAQGYLTAAERMWQMDLLRRLGDGRLAEVFGPQALDSDRLFRTLGLGGSARRALAELDAQERGLLAAYADGVNAWRTQAQGRLPLEYRLAGVGPAPWRPEDSLVVGAYLAFTQSFNLKEELTFLRAAQRLGKERARELFPTDEGVPAPEVAPELPERPLTTLETAGVDTVGALVALLNWPATLGLPVPGPASNGWAARGERTADGAALLANDPHLMATAPGLWYELELSAPGLHAAGLSLPGVPLVLIGHNADLAWGFTSAIADTQDLFLERPTADGTQVERATGTPEPIQTRVQQITVKGAEPVELAVRRTSHGVILNDVVVHPPTVEPGALPALASPYLIALSQVDDPPDRSVVAVLRLNRARTLEEARAAGLDFTRVALNLMLASRDGDIAWQVTGVLPRRGRGAGTFPAPGWIDGYAWVGTVPQGENPTLTNPDGDALVTANNRTVPLDFPVDLGHSWFAPYRAQRIVERLAASPGADPTAMAAMQADRASIQARHLIAALRRIGPDLRAADPAAWVIAERDLLPWDGTMDGASRPAALVVLLESALWRALYGDELGADLGAVESLADLSYNSLQETLRTGESSFWDDVTTPAREGPAEVWARALHAADAQLAATLPEPREQRLARLRTLTFRHAFHPLPVIGRLFDVGPIGVGGAADTLDVTKASPSEPREALVVPSVRVVQVPADWTRTRATLPLGQSGHWLSPYRRDQLDDWRHGRGHPWPWNGPAGAVIGELVLRPRG